MKALILCAIVGLTFAVSTANETNTCDIDEREFVIVDEDFLAGVEESYKECVQMGLLLPPSSPFPLLQCGDTLAIDFDTLRIILDDLSLCAERIMQLHPGDIPPCKNLDRPYNHNCGAYI